MIMLLSTSLTAYLHKSWSVKESDWGIIQQLSGHKSLKMVERYCKANEREI